MSNWISVFAPATVANLGPGFDVLGVAVTGVGDVVEAKLIDRPDVIIEEITGDGGRLPLDAAKNTMGIAAREALKIVGARQGVALKLRKNMPLGSGLGSSAASAAAGAWAVAVLNHFDDKLALLPACLAAEAAVSGYHADNVAPSLLGGLVLIQGYRPLKIQNLPVPKDFHLALVTPEYEVPTAEGRKAVPKTVPIASVVANSGNLAAMVAASFADDVSAWGRAVVDAIVEPARAGLIPGFAAVKQSAMDAGAFGCSIGGSGPTVFAVCDSAAMGARVGAAMQSAFAGVGLASMLNVAAVDAIGARVLTP